MQAIEEDYNYNDLTPKHRQVLDHIADRMPKYKAWQTVHPTCTSMQAALQSVARLLKRPVAIAYLSESIEEKENYINRKHDLPIDEDCKIYLDSIKGLQQDVKQARAMGELKIVAVLEAQITAKQTAYEKLKGMGAYSPIYKELQMAKEEARQRKAQRKIEASNNALNASNSTHDDNTPNDNSNASNASNGITSPLSNDSSCIDITAQILSSLPSDSSSDDSSDDNNSDNADKAG